MPTIYYEKWETSLNYFLWFQPTIILVTKCLNFKCVFKTFCYDIADAIFVTLFYTHSNLIWSNEINSLEINFCKKMREELYMPHSNPQSVCTWFLQFSSLKYPVWWTWFLVYFKLEFYRLQQAEKSSSLGKPPQFIKLDISSWRIAKIKCR